MKLWVIDDEVPPETLALLAEAARVRDVEVEVVVARSVDWSTQPRAEPGDLLYCPATSVTANRVQRRLWQPGVVTFHRDPCGILWEPADPFALFALAGVPTPERIPVEVRTRPLVRAHVEALGGFPVVVRAEAGEGGIGVLLADSWRVLHPLVDHLVERGAHAQLARFVPDAVHWRVVVVGDGVVTAYRNRPQPLDFRSYASDDPADYTAEAPRAALEVALRAVAALALEAGGVDVLVAPDGAVWVLEVNFPFYSPQAEQVSGAPVAQAMVDHLVAKSTGTQTRAPGRGYRPAACPGPAPSPPSSGSTTGPPPGSS